MDAGLRQHPTHVQPGNGQRSRHLLQGATRVSLQKTTRPAAVSPGRDDHLNIFRFQVYVRDSGEPVHHAASTTS